MSDFHNLMYPPGTAPPTRTRTPAEDTIEIPGYELRVGDVVTHYQFGGWGTDRWEQPLQRRDGQCTWRIDLINESGAWMIEGGRTMLIHDTGAEIKFRVRRSQ